MRALTDMALLDIRTVRTGVYRGFNPVVSMTAKGLIAVIVMLLLLYPEQSAAVLDALKTTTLAKFASWYIYLMAAFLVFCLTLVVLPVSSRIKLGPDDSIPDHSTRDWLAMMFCAGIGVGILVFSVSEPISHSLTNPDILGGRVSAGSPEGVASSLRFVFLHWGLSAWGCYALIGLALGLACHRLGQPMNMRSAVAPLFGKKNLEGPLGHIIDITSILAIIAGITTTIVLGLEQICAGLSALTGWAVFADQSGNPPITALLTALVVSIAVAIASIISGVDRGVKWTSRLGIYLALGVFAVFILYGTGFQIVPIFLTSGASYLAALPAQVITVYPAADATGDWQGNWTIFYWAWWIAFAPFVGLFLARISRGRTVREFILGAMLGPTVMCFLWFSGTGGAALLMELDGDAAGRIQDATHAFRIYETLNLMLSPGLAALTKAVLVLLFLVLVVASSTAAIIAIKSIGAAGSLQSETPFHSMTWALVIAAITGAVMSVNGVAAIRDVMIVGAVPFSVIMALMLISVTRMLIPGGRRSGGP